MYINYNEGKPSKPFLWVVSYSGCGNKITLNNYTNCITYTLFFNVGYINIYIKRKVLTIQYYLM